MKTHPIYYFPFCTSKNAFQRFTDVFPRSEQQIKAAWIHIGQVTTTSRKVIIKWKMPCWMRHPAGTAHGTTTDLCRQEPRSPCCGDPERLSRSCPARCQSRCRGFSASLKSHLLTEATKRKKGLLTATSAVYGVTTRGV